MARRRFRLPISRSSRRRRRRRKSRSLGFGGPVPTHDEERPTPVWGPKSLGDEPTGAEDAEEHLKRAEQLTRPEEQATLVEEKPPAEEERRSRRRRPSLPSLPGDLGFRISTRFRAIGYWLREKGQQVSRGARAGASGVADWWYERSGATRMRILAVAAVIGLYAIVKFAPLPGIPCGISAAKECAPIDSADELVPADALLYSHITLDSDTGQFDRASKLVERIPAVGSLGGELINAVPTPSNAELDFAGDIDPWAGDDAAFSLLAGPKGANLPVALISVDDRGGAEKFLGTIAATEPTPEKIGDVTLSNFGSGFAAAFVDDFLVFGDATAVRQVIGAAPGETPTIADGDPSSEVRDELPENRFADVYLSAAGIKAFLSSGGPGASQLDTFVDYGASRGLAAAADAHEDGIELDLVSVLDEKLAEQSPSLFTGLPGFEPSLADEAGSRALGYVGIGEVGPSLAEILKLAGSTQPDLANSFQSFANQLQQEAGVNPLNDLLPALTGQAALVAEPTDAAPFASLIVDGVDEDPARKALARLQKPLIDSITLPEGQAPRFEEQKIEGVDARSVQISPTVNLTYAIFDGKLVASTDPGGVAQVRAGDEHLNDTGPYEAATEDLPDKVSALVFLNLDELLGLAEQAGLAEDPLYASFRDDITELRSLGLAVRGDESTIDSELFLATK